MVDKLELSDFEFNVGITPEMFRVLNSPLADNTESISRLDGIHVACLFHARIVGWGGESGPPILENLNFLNIHSKITENMPRTPLPPVNSNLSRNTFLDPRRYLL